MDYQLVSALQIELFDDGFLTMVSLHRVQHRNVFFFCPRKAWRTRLLFAENKKKIIQLTIDKKDLFYWWSTISILWVIWRKATSWTLWWGMCCAYHRASRSHSYLRLLFIQRRWTTASFDEKHFYEFQDILESYLFPNIMRLFDERNSNTMKQLVALLRKFKIILKVKLLKSGALAGKFSRFRTYSMFSAYSLKSKLTEKNQQILKTGIEVWKKRTHSNIGFQHA